MEICYINRIFSMLRWYYTGTLRLLFNIMPAYFYSQCVKLTRLFRNLLLKPYGYVLTFIWHPCCNIWKALYYGLDCVHYSDGLHDFRSVCHCVCLWVCVCMHVCTYVRVHACVYVSMLARQCVCIYVCM